MPPNSISDGQREGDSPNRASLSLSSLISDRRASASGAELDPASGVAHMTVRSAATVSSAAAERRAGATGGKVGRRRPKARERRRRGRRRNAAVTRGASPAAAAAAIA